MYYVIDYEIAAVILLVIMIVSKIKLFKSKDRTTRMYMIVLVVALICGILDIFTALCQGNIIHVTDKYMLLFETIYLILILYSNYYLLRLICFRTHLESEALHIFNFVLISVLSFFLLSNLGQSFMFHYENLKFVGSSWFDFIYLINMAIYIEIAVVLVEKGKRLRRKILILCINAFLLPVVCIIAQYINDRILVSELGVVAAMFLFGFTLGEEDYASWELKRKELEETEDEEARIFAEAQKAKQVKIIFLDRITNKIETPLSGMIRAGEEMREFDVTPEIGEYIAQINKATNQLQEFTSEFHKVAEESNE